MSLALLKNGNGHQSDYPNRVGCAVEPEGADWRFLPQQQQLQIKWILFFGILIVVSDASPRIEKHGLTDRMVSAALGVRCNLSEFVTVRNGQTYFS